MEFCEADSMQAPFSTTLVRALISNGIPRMNTKALIDSLSVVLPETLAVRRVQRGGCAVMQILQMPGFQGLTLSY
jgi:hypothetical protein